jgi:hypothetical protein
MMDELPNSNNIQTATFGPGASKIFTSSARYIIAVAGQRGGKTTTGSYWSYNQATKMRTEQTTRGVQVVPPAGIICAPTYDLLRHSTLNRFFEEFPVLERYYKEYKKEMNIPIAKQGGKAVYSKVFTRSLEDPQLLRGLKAWWFWADEGDIAPEDSWEVLKGRISDHDDGQGLITSTLAMNSWINRLIYEPMLSGRIGGVDIVTWPSNDRPGFPVSEWERLRSEMDPIQFARDYEGKFSFEHGLVYGDILKYGIIDAVPEEVEILATFYAVDYGLNHPTVIMVMGYGSDGCWYVLNEHASPMMDVDQINLVLESNLTLYRPQYEDPWATYYDPAGGIAALSLTPNVFPQPAVKDIPTRVTLVRNFIYQHRVFVLSHCHFTKKELGLYTFDPVKHVPLDKNNHAMDCIGYIIHNAWELVDGLTKKEPTKPKSRVQEDLEARGLLKDGIFQNILNGEDNFIL